MAQIQPELFDTLPYQSAQTTVKTPSLTPSSVQEELIVYTDGACSGNPGRGGWGCVIIDGNEVFSASGGEVLTTNNRMELMAAISALTAVQQNDKWQGRPVLVNIDSQYVKNGITTWIKNWKKNGWRTSDKKSVKNKDLWEILDKLNTTLVVHWNWVKGHAGIKYNELCDELARKGAENAK